MSRNALNKIHADLNRHHSVSHCLSYSLQHHFLNECMNVYFYILHISHIVSWGFAILVIELDRTSACEGTSGWRYQFIFNVTHPPNPCMKCRMKLEIDLHHFLQEIDTFMFTKCPPKSSKRNKQSPLTKLEEKKIKRRNQQKC